jgi:hypothetical protein
MKEYGRRGMWFVYLRYKSHKQLWLPNPQEDLILDASILFKYGYNP